MREFVASIEGEYRRYKALGEATLEQVRDEDLCAREHEATNSIATIVWHVSGNLSSRFSDFLHADGEKPWRDRDEEFVARTVTRTDLMGKWQQGWSVLVSQMAFFALFAFGAAACFAWYARNYVMVDHYRVD